MNDEHRDLPHPEKGPTILVTGGAGVIGTELLPRLVAGSAAPEIVAIVHRREIHRPGVRCIRGDVTAPHLGLGGAEYRSLARQVDVVVHAAANVSFKKSEDHVGLAQAQRSLRQHAREEALVVDDRVGRRRSARMNAGGVEQRQDAIAYQRGHRGIGRTSPD